MTAWLRRIEQLAGTAVVRFLLLDRRGNGPLSGLDGGLCFMAVWWALWTLAFPQFWTVYPSLAEVRQQTFGDPAILSYVLLLGGLAGFYGLRANRVGLRIVGSVAGFMAWACMAVGCIRHAPMAASGVAIYSGLAMAELLSYLRAHLESHGLSLDAGQGGGNELG